MENKKIKLAIFVHDFHLEVGHSRALIEQIRNIPRENIEHIKIFSYSCSDPKKIFPQLKGKVKIYTPLLCNLYPFILKVLYYHIWAIYMDFRINLKNHIKIGIGVAALNVDVTNIQFVHCQWEPLFFKHQKMKFYVKLYKKVLYCYLRKCEEFLFSRKNIKIYALSRFVYNYLKNRFSIEENQIAQIYSGINIDSFDLPEKNRLEVFNELKMLYPALEKINPRMPTYLFVGAYERKGLQKVISCLEKFETYQLIIVGQGDSTEEMQFSRNPNHVIAKVKFTQRISDFYYVSDSFFFPTIYEPFGLVLFEAAAMGIQIITRKDNVGASELLEGLKEVYFLSESDNCQIPELNYLGREQKLDLREERIDRLKKYSWKKSSLELFNFLVD